MTKPLSAPDLVCHRFGGGAALASLLQLNRTSIWRWQASGRIPAKHQQRLLSLAKRRGIPLDPAELVSGGQP